MQTATAHPLTAPKPSRGASPSPSALLTRVCVSMLALAAIAAPSSGAAAQAPAPSMKVSYADLQLETTAGAGTLLKRINVAAARVCEGVRFGTSGVETSIRYRACTSAAVDAAVRNIASERLTALYRGAQPTRIARAGPAH